MESNDPLKLFHHYWEEAKKLKDPDADSVSLATVDAKNRPHVRTVLLKTFRKGVRERSEREGEAPTALPLEGALPAPAIGFVTREGGEKIAQIKHCNDVECCLAWSTLSLQVRLRCTATEMENAILEYLWSLRTRDAKIVYHLGFHQSVVVPSYQFLEKKFHELKERLKGKKDIPLSKLYTGYILHPYSIEFLHHKKSRLNKRERYEKKGEVWIKQILAP